MSSGNLLSICQYQQKRILISSVFNEIDKLFPASLLITGKGTLADVNLSRFLEKTLVKVQSHFIKTANLLFFFGQISFIERLKVIKMKRETRIDSCINWRKL